MSRLSKLRYSQSYTYFTWRNSKQELTDYFSSMIRSEFFRPNLWPNTPDILPEFLQAGGRAAFTIRLILASTLGAKPGIYWQDFELCENVAREPGSEEYLNSEKYELKHWDDAHPGSLTNLIARVNKIRRNNPGLAGRRQPAVSPDGQFRSDLLQQSDRRSIQYHRGTLQPRPVPYTNRLGDCGSGFARNRRHSKVSSSRFVER